MQFFREAPIGAIILVVVGGFMVLVVSSSMVITEARRQAAREKQEQETGLPSPILEDGSLRTAIVADVAGTVLIAIGFGIWIVG